MKLIIEIKKENIMNVVIAPDSFKGSLSAIQASEIMGKAIKSVDADSQAVLKPMADGGEGTLESFLASTDGVRIALTCTGPLGEKIDTTYGIIDSNTAVIECASIAGLVQVPEDKRNPDFTTTFGIGEAMLDALDEGCTSIVLGLGGSGTNDGGRGMLLALGMKAWNVNGEEVGPFGKDLQHITGVSFEAIDKRISHTDIKVACDVDNPLCGERGATSVYGPQKGLPTEKIMPYDIALNQYGKAVESALNKQLQNVAGDRKSVVKGLNG